MSEGTLSRDSLKIRKAIAITLVLIGSLTCIAGLLSWVVAATSPFNSIVIIILGMVILVVGILVIVTEMFESWLNRSQAALVDGLQAG